LGVYLFILWRLKLRMHAHGEIMGADRQRPGLISHLTQNDASRLVALQEIDAACIPYTARFCA
ncbi:MAG: hypothetical protein KGS48_13960, partial [Bacteroidetes bacterium]|nr:hypothetical protein [Bacteroidota bacterium]